MLEELGLPREISVAPGTETTDREVPVDAHAPHVVGDSASERFDASDVVTPLLECGCGQGDLLLSTRQVFHSRPAEGEYLCIIQLGRPSLTLSGNQVRHEMPPKAAPALGRPKGAAAPMHQSHEAHHPGATAPLPRGAYSPGRSELTGDCP